MNLFGHIGGRSVLRKEFLTCRTKFDYMYPPEYQALNYCKVRKCWWRGGLFHDFSQLIGAIPQTHENIGQNLSKMACSQHAGTEDSHKLITVAFNKTSLHQRGFFFPLSRQAPSQLRRPKTTPRFFSPQGTHTPPYPCGIFFYLQNERSRLQRSTSQKAVFGALN